MSRIAVVGSGIAGLSAAYLLSRRHEVHLFERDDRLGGHTHTISVETSCGPLPIDTGFIVHNDRTYPNFVRLLGELGVNTRPSDMSFAVSCCLTGLEYSSRGVGGFLAQWQNLFRPQHLRLLAGILRFNRSAPRLLDDPDADGITLREYLTRHRYDEAFTRFYLYPMASAIWSASPTEVLSFPAVTLIRFFNNHGMLTIGSHPQWKTIPGGAVRYIGALTAPYRDRLHTGCRILGVSRTGAGVRIRIAGRPALTFDEVVFACHGDEVLSLLEAPTPEEHEVLGRFRTSRNEVWLHTDSSVLPRRPRAQASWNYHVRGDEPGATVTYDLTRLQGLPAPERYCITLNPGETAPARVIRKMVYRHPLYDLDSMRAQGRWRSVSGRNRTHYCGAYWAYGFHEDGLNSAIRVARDLGVVW